MKFIITLALVVIVGCASTPESVSLSVFPDGDHAEGVSMLADANNPAEMKAAPVIVRLALYLNNTKKLLKNKQISVDQAIASRDCADQIKVVVNDAVAMKNLYAIDVAARRITECQSIVEVKK